LAVVTTDEEETTEREGCDVKGTLKNKERERERVRSKWMMWLLQILANERGSTSRFGFSWQMFVREFGETIGRGHRRRHLRQLCVH